MSLEDTFWHGIDQLIQIMFNSKVFPHQMFHIVLHVETQCVSKIFNVYKNSKDGKRTWSVQKKMWQQVLSLLHNWCVCNTPNSGAANIIIIIIISNLENKQGGGGWLPLYSFDSASANRNTDLCYIKLQELQDSIHEILVWLAK